MASDQRSPREIERDIERERHDLRRNVDEVMNRLTFEDAWNRAGRYMRENRSDLGGSFMTVAREKPAAVGLVAIGVAWLMFGPAQTTAPRDGRGRTSVPEPRPYGRGDEAGHEDDLPDGLQTGEREPSVDRLRPLGTSDRSHASDDPDLPDRRTPLETQPDLDPLGPSRGGTTPPVATSPGAAPTDTTRTEPTAPGKATDPDDPARDSGAAGERPTTHPT